MRALTGLVLLLALAACDTRAEADGPNPTPAPGTARVPPTRPVYPLHVAPSGRHLVDAAGTPVLLHGDAAWSAVVNLSIEEAERYLDDRQRKGVTAVYINLIEWAFSDQDPPWRNVYGADPFSRTVDGYVPDLTAPTEVYWRHVDAILAAADARGITVVAFPAYTGWEQGFDGWAFALHANGPDRVGAYGAFLGQRYAGQPNLIWAAGGDWGPTGRYDLTDEYAALVAGIRQHDGAHLWTAHGGQESGVDVYGSLGLDLNTTYRYPPASVPDAVYTDYTRAPVLPFVFFEGWYENEWGVRRQALRSQAYASLLGGAAGQFYGNNPVWLFGAGWEAALDDPGALDQVHVGDLFRSRPFERLVPDYAHAVVLGDRGDRSDGTYVAAARADDGSTVIAYVPGPRPIDVDLDRLAGRDARAWCVDPATGAATDRGVIRSEGLRTFAPCTPADWVLVLDDAALGLGAPGTPS